MQAKSLQKAQEVTEDEKYELETELQDIDASLDELYDIDHELIPFVDDRVRHDIYDLQERRSEIKALLGNSQ